MVYVPNSLDLISIRYIFNDERIFNFSLNETNKTQENYIWESKEKLWNNNKIKINYGLLEKPPIDDLLFVQKFNFSNLDGESPKDYFKIKEINITWENVNSTNLDEIYYCKEFFNTKEDILKKCTSNLDKRYLLNQQLYIYWFNWLVNDYFSSLNIRIFFDFWNIHIWE